MINYLHYLLHKPKNGWDPISNEFANKYANINYSTIDNSLIKEFDSFCDGLNFKKVLDLGAGPGQYSIEFKKMGAYVTWFDISKNYLNIAKEKSENGLDNYVLDYMDNVRGKFDAVFSRVCWYYCINDKKFALNVLKCLNPGGKLFVTLHNEDFGKNEKTQSLIKYFYRFTRYLNNEFGYKIGHPHMSKKRIEKLFNSLNTSSCKIIHDDFGTTTIKIIV